MMKQELKSKKPKLKEEKIISSSVTSHNKNLKWTYSNVIPTITEVNARTEESNTS